MPARCIRRFSSAAIAAACAVTLVRAQAPEPSKADLARAAEDYQQYCALCHGEDRAGYANDHAPSLKSKSLLESAFPAALLTIAYGRTGTPMGGYLEEVGGPLSRRDIMSLVAWLQRKESVEPIRMAFEPVEGDIERGAGVYAEYCAECHGESGEGGTGTALANPAMLMMTPDPFLRHAIVHGRQGTEMPAFAETLTPRQIDDVTAFLGSRAAGWEVTRPELREPPAPSEYVLNPDAPPPAFDLEEGRYVRAEQLHSALEAGRRMVLLDTRVTSMWQRAHIAGSVPMPYYSSREEVLGALPEDETWIVAYCECPRAAADTVVDKLRESGFENTAVLFEGIQGWVTAGYPVTAGKVERSASD